MKILKVYDKINRIVFEKHLDSGNIIFREYQDDSSLYYFINPRIFQVKKDRVSFFSYQKVKNNVVIESLDITPKHVQYKLMNEKGKLLHSEKHHLKDNKSFLIVDRIYDEEGKFIEIENHKGNKNLSFDLKNEIINQYLNINYGQQED